jgi:mRNA-degrading endonuclease RelE of RelBE toxin-antitoxin system
MDYEIKILPEALNDINNAFEYYEKISFKVLNSFKNELEETYNKLEINPFYQIKFKHLKVIPFKNFLYIIFFEVDKVTKIVYVFSVFHTFQNPNKYPK